MLAAYYEVSRQAANPEWQAATKRNQHACHNQYNSQQDQSASEAHTSILALQPLDGVATPAMLAPQNLHNPMRNQFVQGEQFLVGLENRLSVAVISDSSAGA